MGAGKMREPLVSVVIPVYNVAPYLERCLDSVIAQTYRNLEIICVNDGSTDESGEILAKYAEKDARIRIITQENRGLVAARKAGIREAHGKYATAVDSDDWIEPKMYENLVKEAEEHQADIVTSGMIRDYGNHLVREEDMVPAGVYDKEGLLQKVFPTMIYTGRFFESGIRCNICNKLYRLELLRGCQLEVDDRIESGEDGAVVYPCFLRAERVVVTRECYYRYCLRGDSIVGVRNPRDMESIRILRAHLLEKIEKQGILVDELKRQVEFYIAYALLLKVPESLVRASRNNLLIEPFSNLEQGSRVVLYGAGKFGWKLKQYFEQSKLCEVVLWVDKKNRSEEGIEAIERLQALSADAYDRVVIGVAMEVMCNEIQSGLEAMGISPDRIARIDMNAWMEEHGIEQLFGEEDSNLRRG